MGVLNFSWFQLRTKDLLPKRQEINKTKSKSESSTGESIEELTVDVFNVVLRTSLEKLKGCEKVVGEGVAIGEGDSESVE